MRTIDLPAESLISKLPFGAPVLNFVEVGARNTRSREAQPSHHTLICQNREAINA
jgi:hypothetical protein